MAWRVIVRLSNTSDTGSVVRNAAASTLRNIGLTNTATGTWESASCSESTAAQELAHLLMLLANPGQVTNADPNVTMKHVWIYIDKA